jgi:hypothetical protein
MPAKRQRGRETNHKGTKARREITKRKEIKECNATTFTYSAISLSSSSDLRVFVPSWLIFSAHKKSSRKSTRPRGAKDAKPFRERLDAISLAPSGRSTSVSGSCERRGVCRSDSASFRAALAAAKIARRELKARRRPIPPRGSEGL